MIEATDAQLIEHLRWMARNSRSADLLTRVIDRMAKLSHDNIVLMDSQKQLAEKLSALRTHNDELMGRIRTAGLALGYVR